ncbi:hypothetical protein ACFWJT_07210, partial [Streptomyces sp. NPDC127069]
MADPQGQGFEPATGDGAEPSDAGRAAELRTAYEGLLQIRRLLTGGERGPAPWELRMMPRAVALVLEAGGVQPSGGGPGPRGRAGPQPGPPPGPGGTNGSPPGAGGAPPRDPRAPPRPP